MGKTVDKLPSLPTMPQEAACLRDWLFLFVLLAIGVTASLAEQQGAFVGLSAEHDLVLMPETNKKVLVGGLDIHAVITALQSQLTAQA